MGKIEVVSLLQPFGLLEELLKQGSNERDRKNRQKKKGSPRPTAGTRVAGLSGVPGNGECLELGLAMQHTRSSYDPALYRLSLQGWWDHIFAFDDLL